MAINKINRVVLNEEVLNDLDSKATKQELVDAKTELTNNMNEIYQGISWKSPVASFDRLRVEYPNAEDGWKATTMDTNITYQYDTETDKWFPTSINALPVVTVSNDGLMSKEDKAKVNTVEIGAQKNLTPEQVLEKVKTVDGQNSGLDADLFHGRLPDTFADKVHNHNGEYYTKTESNTLLNGKAQKVHNHIKTDITDFAHTHPTSEVTGFGESVKSTILSGLDLLHGVSIKATDTILSAMGKLQKQINDTNSIIPTKTSQLTNDSTFVTQADLGSAGYGDMTKAVYDINNNGKVDIAELAESVGWVNVTGKPANYTPSSHTHAKSEVGLSNVDNLKQATKTEFNSHITEVSPHQYGGKYEWRYNPTTETLDLVVIV